MTIEISEWTERIRFVSFYDGEYGTIIVFPYCPVCGNRTQIWMVPINKWDDNPSFEGWVCKNHGEVKPEWMRGEQ